MRKQRSSGSAEVPALQPKRRRKEPVQVACQAAPQNIQAVASDLPRGRLQEESGINLTQRLAERLIVGRTEALLRLLKETRLFNFEDKGDVALNPQAARPTRGVCAKLGSNLVYILDTFTRYQVRTADVAFMLPADEPATFSLGRVQSCPCRDLTDTQPARVSVRGRRVRVTLLDAAQAHEHAPEAVERLSVALSFLQVPLPSESQDRPRSRDADDIVEIYPEAAKIHKRCAAKFGELHNIAVCEDRRSEPRFILDLPLPIPFLAQSFRCKTCNNMGPLVDRIPMSKLRGLPAEANMQYFTVTDQDIRGFFPSVLVCQTDHQAPAYFTPRFFFELCKAIYETFNVRQVRRQLAALYSSFTLARQLAILV